MLVGLAVIVVLLLLVIASQTRPKGMPLIRPGFLYALGAIIALGAFLLAIAPH